MHADGNIAVTERFERGDLISLQRDDSRQNDIEKERGDREKDRGNDRPHALQLADLVRQEAIGNLIAASMRPQAAVRLDDRVEPLDYFFLVGPGSQIERDVIECAFHIERGSQGLAAHPENAEPLVVRDQRPDANRVDVFGGKRRADDPQVLFAAVDDGGKFVAGTKPVSFREPLGGQHFVVVPRLDVPARPQVQGIERYLSVFGDGDQSPGSRLFQIVKVERHVADDAGLHMRDAGDFGNACCE